MVLPSVLVVRASSTIPRCGWYFSGVLWLVWVYCGFWFDGLVYGVWWVGYDVFGVAGLIVLVCYDAIYRCVVGVLICVSIVW